MEKLDITSRAILESIADSPGKPIIDYLEPLSSTTKPVLKLRTLYDKVAEMRDLGLIDADSEVKKFCLLSLTSAGFAAIGRIQTPSPEEARPT